MFDAKLIPKLLARLAPEEDPEVHNNVAQVLVEIATFAGPNKEQAYIELFDEANLSTLLDALLAHRSSLESGLALVVEQLKLCQNKSESCHENEPSFLINQLIKHFPTLMNVLRTTQSQQDAPMNTSFGTVVPFGAFCFKILEFFC